MVFSSTVFLFGFLPLFLLVYLILPWRSVRNGVLLAFSLLFYAWGEPVYVWLMIGSIVANWLFSLILASTASRGQRRVVLVLGLAVNLAILGFYKYEDFLAQTVNAALGERFIAELDLALPIRISFYTLQAVTYIVDVY